MFKHAIAASPDSTSCNVYGYSTSVDLTDDQAVKLVEILSSKWILIERVYRFDGGIKVCRHPGIDWSDVHRAVVDGWADACRWRNKNCDLNVTKH